MSPFILSMDFPYLFAFLQELEENHALKGPLATEDVRLKKASILDSRGI